MGHAIERHKHIRHGEAVGVGMVLAARLSHLKGLLSASEVDRVEQMVRSAGLPSGMEVDPEEIYQNIRKDKKKSGEDVHFILLEGLGQAIVRSISLSELKVIVYDLC